MTTWNKINFPDASSPIMEQMIFFHDHSMMILITVTILVTYMMIYTCLNKLNNKFLLEGQELETIWTIMPAILLVFIALPSLHLLYMMDEISSPNITLKSIGHQWYWSYEYSDFENFSFDSFMLPADEFTKNNFRLLDVDNRTPIPTNMNIRLLVSSADVIHSWTVPSMGVKIDAVPGRINQLPLFSSRSGLTFGQCSEICGANHSFMPIVIESILPKSFLKILN